MSLLLAGIDEAGYGPTLGPLCVGMTLFLVRDWSPGDSAPDLWKLLGSTVCTKPSDARRRIPIADSKALKLANDTKTRHPLVHLERGVLAFIRGLSAEGGDVPASPRECLPADDGALFQRLGAVLEPRAWYRTEPTRLPVGVGAGELAIAAARIAGACETAGVELLDMRCLVVPESVFNEAVRRTGSKAEATALAVGEHLRRLMTRADAVGEQVRIVCDQLGGRTQYEELLARELPGRGVKPLTKNETRSRYGLSETAIVQFMPEAEAAHLPVALASMVAKFIRELAMMRFNRYWCSRVPEVRPTAGYATDARRWLEEMREVLHPDERTAMVRIA